MRLWAWTRMADRIAKSVAAAALGALLWLGAAPAPAAAADCSFGGCVPVSQMPATDGSDIASILRRSQRFFGVSAEAYIVSSDDVRARLPYMLPRQEPFIMKHQIHIPEVYHARTEINNIGKRHYVWHYILGHEMAHVYQKENRLIELMTAPFPNKSVVIVELHADYLAGFFMASEFRLSATTIDNLLREIKDLPVGPPGSASYHGQPGQRFFVTTQGALAAFKQPTPSLREASGAGVECVLNLLFLQDGEQKSLSEVCK